MILHPIIDLLKRIVVALPDYGSGVLAPDLLDYEEITIAEDRLTLNTNGNTQYFQTTYIPSLQNSSVGYPTILIFIDNTFTGDLCAQSAIRLSTFNNGINNGNPPSARFYLRSSGDVLASENFAFYTGAGTVLHRYVFVRAEP